MFVSRPILGRMKAGIFARSFICPVSPRLPGWSPVVMSAPSDLSFQVDTLARVWDFHVPVNVATHDSSVDESLRYDGIQSGHLPVGLIEKAHNLGCARKVATSN